MSKKKKKNGISSEARTCFIFAAIFLVCGIASLIYGKKFYHSDDMVSIDDITTGQTATIVNVEKRERNLSPSDKDLEKKNGASDDEIRWEYYVEYEVEANGETYHYDDVVRYRDDGKNTPHVGDTDVINYAIKDGEFIVHPETEGTNNVVICGWILLFLCIPAAGIGFFLKK